MIHAELCVLDAVGMRKIHEAALRVLRTTGLEFGHPQGLEMLQAQGVRVDLARSRVYLEAEQVLETMRQFAGVRSLTLTEKGVDHPQHRRRLVDGLVGNVGSNHGYLYNSCTRSVEPLDYEIGRRLLQIKRSLPQVAMGAPGFTLQNVPSRVASVHTTALGVMYGAQGTPGVASPEEGPWIARVMQAAGLWSPETEYFEIPIVLSPLRLVGSLAECVVERSLRGKLTLILTMPIRGASSPVTVAGDLVVRVAETFGFNTISRLLCTPAQEFQRPVLNSDSVVMDMRKASLNVCTPDTLLTTAAYLQMMGDFYKTRVVLPIYLSGNPFHPDVQSGMERVSTALVRLLLGTCATPQEKVIGAVDLGVVGQNMAISFEQIVIDHEYLGFLERILEGVRVNDQTIAADVIEEVGPGGTFLTEEHTLQHHQAETWHSDLFSIQEYDSWLAGGRSDVLQTAGQTVDRICSDRPEPVLAADRVRQVQEVVRAAERALLGEESGLVPA